MPEIVEDDVYNQLEVVKCADGSVVYDIGYRTRSTDQINQSLIEETYVGAPLMNMADFNELDPVFTTQLEAFIEYLQAKGIEVILYLPPYHEYFYSVAQSRVNEHPAFFEVEDYCRNIAQQYGLEVYGGYDSLELGLAFEDFMDSYHMRAESLTKVLPVI
jgi:hypothetical protein